MQDCQIVYLLTNVQHTGAICCAAMERHECLPVHNLTQRNMILRLLKSSYLFSLWTQSTILQASKKLLSIQMATQIWSRGNWFCLTKTGKSTSSVWFCHCLDILAERFTHYSKTTFQTKLDPPGKAEAADTCNIENSIARYSSPNIRII